MCVADQWTHIKLQLTWLHVVTHTSAVYYLSTHTTHTQKPQNNAVNKFNAYMQFTYICPRHTHSSILHSSHTDMVLRHSKTCTHGDSQTRCADLKASRCMERMTLATCIVPGTVQCLCCLGCVVCTLSWCSVHTGALFLVHINFVAVMMP